MKAAPAAKSHAPRGSTRDRLIDAAFAVVARDGLEAASVKSIAIEAGVTPGLVHYHFSDKDAVLEAALRRGLDDYLARNRERRERTAAADQIDAFFDAARDSIPSDRDFFRVRLALAVRATSDPGLAAAISEINGAAVAEVARVFAAAQGLAEPGDLHLTLAATIKAVFDGLMLAWLNDPTFPIEAAGGHLRQMVKAALS